MKSMLSSVILLLMLNGCAEMACKYAPGDNGDYKPPSQRSCEMP